MRVTIATLVALLAGSPALAEEKCTGEVKTAFEKQAAQPRLRSIITHPGTDGTVTRTISLVRPDRLHMITEAPYEEAGRLETISIGQWAWGADSDGSWTEHKPNIAKVIAMDVEKMAAPAPVSANFSCMGKVSFEGKDYLGYRADPGKGDDGVELAATVYVEEASGLPMFNVVAPTSGDGAPRLKAAYAYGDDITVEPPAGFALPAKEEKSEAAPAPASPAEAVRP
jgi:hypothetical protein